MAFPPPTIQTNITDATDQAGLHPQLHNALAQGVNDLTGHAVWLGGHVEEVNNRLTLVESNAVAADTALDARLDAVEDKNQNQEDVLDFLYGATAANGIIRGRTNIDAVTDGGSVRYTTNIFTDNTIVDVGDGSGFTTGTGVFAVAASTIPDGGSDLTCYLNIGARSVAVGSRLEGDGATYLTWVGRVMQGEVINVRVRMPVPHAVTGGRLEIWRVAVSE